MKLLHIIPSLIKGGAERLVLDICHELQGRKDVELKLLTFRNENDYKDLSKGIDVSICPARVVPSITGRPVSEIEEFKKFIDDFSPDIIHSHLYEAEVISREYLLPGATYFTHAHDNIIQFRDLKPDSFLKKYALTNWYEKNRMMKKYRRAGNYFIANSEDTFAYLKENLPGYFHSKIVQLTNAINLSHFPFVSRIMPSKKIRLITVGSLVAKKNQVFLIDVIKQLQQLSSLPVHLDVLGDGPLKSFLSEEVKNEYLSSSITFHGIRDDVFEFLSAGDVYVHPATYEPFGLAIAEAMSTGLPVVCLDAKGNRGLIDDGVNGFMIGEKDAELFAKKILEIIKDEKSYRSFSSAAVKKAQLHDIKNYVDKLMMLYQKAVQHDAISSANSR